MAATAIQMALANMIRGDADLMELLPGGVWTRRIRRNEAPPGNPPTPGSTPEAFDHEGRFLRSVSILNGEASADLYGPPDAFYAFPEIWLRCMPHESEKRRIEQAASMITAMLSGETIPLGTGRSAVGTVVARMGPDDDPDLRPAVVSMIRVQIDSVWSTP